MKSTLELVKIYQEPNVLPLNFLFYPFNIHCLSRMRRKICKKPLSLLVKANEFPAYFPLNQSIHYCVWWWHSPWNPIKSLLLIVKIPLNPMTSKFLLVKSHQMQLNPYCWLTSFEIRMSLPRRLPLRQRDGGLCLCWGSWLGHPGAKTWEDTKWRVESTSISVRKVQGTWNFHFDQEHLKFDEHVISTQPTRVRFQPTKVRFQTAKVVVKLPILETFARATASRWHWIPLLWAQKYHRNSKWV
jgi:hypothetical protein